MITRAVERTARERRGVFLLVLSALAFSAMSVEVKLGGMLLPVSMLVFARGAVALAISVAMLRAQKLPAWGRDKPALVLRACFGIGGLACFYYAVTRLPLAEATLIHFLNPVFTALIAARALGERVSRRVVLAMAFSLMGTLLVTRPGAVFGAHPALPLDGVLAALGGAIFSAFAYATVRRLARTDHPDVIVFYFSLLATLATAPFAAVGWRAPSPTGWLVLLAIGVTTQLAQVLLTRGLAEVPAARGTTVGYIQIVFAAAWGMLLFGEALNGWTLLGAVFVLGSVVNLFRAESLARGPGDGHPTRHVERAPPQRTGAE